MSLVNKKIVSGASTIFHSLVVPLFVLIFTIYYRPYGVYEVLQMEHASFYFNSTIIFCIGAVWMGLEFFRSKMANSKERSDFNPSANISFP